MKRFFLSFIIAAVIHASIVGFSPPLAKIGNKRPAEIKPISISISVGRPKQYDAPKAGPEPTDLRRLDKLSPPKEIIRNQPETESDNKILSPREMDRPGLKKRKDKEFYHIAKIKKKQEPIQPVIKSEPIVKKDSRSDKHIDNVLKGLPVLQPEKKAIQPDTEINFKKETVPVESAVSQKKRDRIEFPSPLVEQNQIPGYPLIARKRGYRGLVELFALVSETGDIARLNLLKSSGYKILDRHAVDNVKKWRFKPGKRNGVPEPTWVKIPIKFQLE